MYTNCSTFLSIFSAIGPFNASEALPIAYEYALLVWMNKVAVAHSKSTAAPHNRHADRSNSVSNLWSIITLQCYIEDIISRVHRGEIFSPAAKWHSSRLSTIAIVTYCLFIASTKRNDVWSQTLTHHKAHKMLLLLDRYGRSKLRWVTP